VFKSLDDALRTHELVKVALARHHRGAGQGRANALATEASRRGHPGDRPHRHALPRNPDIKGKAGDPPPWRR
jgi:hypothetical protein